MRKPRSLLQELAKRTSVQKLARKFDRTPATIEKWLRAGPPVSARAEVAEAHARSERARIAADARRVAAEEKEARARLTRELRSERAKEAWKRRRLDDARKAPGMPTFDGRTAGGHVTLSAMIAADDPQWLAFLALAESQGLSKREAFAKWYSPKLNKGSGKRRYKRKKKPTRPKKRRPTKRKRR